MLFVEIALWWCGLGVAVQGGVLLTGRMAGQKAFETSYKRSIFGPWGQFAIMMVAWPGIVFAFVMGIAAYYLKKMEK